MHHHLARKVQHKRDEASDSASSSAFLIICFDVSSTGPAEIEVPGSQISLHVAEDTSGGGSSVSSVTLASYDEVVNECFVSTDASQAVVGPVRVGSDRCVLSRTDACWDYYVKVSVKGDPEVYYMNCMSYIVFV